MLLVPRTNRGPPRPPLVLRPPVPQRWGRRSGRGSPVGPPRADGRAARGRAGVAGPPAGPPAPPGGRSGEGGALGGDGDGQRPARARHGEAAGGAAGARAGVPGGGRGAAGGPGVGPGAGVVLGTGRAAAVALRPRGRPAAGPRLFGRGARLGSGPRGGGGGGGRRSRWSGRPPAAAGRSWDGVAGRRRSVPGPRTPPSGCWSRRTGMAAPASSTRSPGRGGTARRRPRVRTACGRSRTCYGPRAGREAAPSRTSWSWWARP